MNTPYLTIDLRKLEHNLKIILELCKKNHLELTPITKVIMGDPRIASIYTKYTDSIGDSRIHDIKRMIRNEVKSSFMLIRSPSMHESKEVVTLCECSLNSELSMIRALSETALDLKKTHSILIMIEMGDLREGVLLDDFKPFLKECLQLPRIEIIGIGANATCFAGLIPTPSNLKILETAGKIYKSLIGKDGLISGGGTNLFHLIQSKSLPNYINHIRCGEGIVMGVDAVYKNPIEGCFQDCFELNGEVIELKFKPSLPIGTFTHNAFGEETHLKDKGIRKRAILNIGRLDTDITGIKPIESGIEILGASSDHLILDVEDSTRKLEIGSLIPFHLNYSGLLYAMSSDYVGKRYLISED